MTAQFKFEAKHVFSYDATLSQAEIIGPVPDDIRVNFYVTDGEVWLPDRTKIGKLRPVGGDWLTVRRDNQGALDVRATVEMNDGALLYYEKTQYFHFFELNRLLLLSPEPRQ
jgi:hypothetical protein